MGDGTVVSVFALLPRVRYVDRVLRGGNTRGGAGPAMTARSRSRQERIIQLMRDRGGKMGGPDISEALGVTLRTVYRLIDALRAQNVPIKGNRAGFVLSEEKPNE
jgi:biotin operon repressor